MNLLNWNHPKFQWSRINNVSGAGNSTKVFVQRKLCFSKSRLQLDRESVLLKNHCLPYPTKINAMIMNNEEIPSSTYSNCPLKRGHHPKKGIACIKGDEKGTVDDNKGSPPPNPLTDEIKNLAKLEKCTVGTYSLFSAMSLGLSLWQLQPTMLKIAAILFGTVLVVSKFIANKKSPLISEGSLFELETSLVQASDTMSTIIHIWNLKKKSNPTMELSMFFGIGISKFIFAVIDIKRNEVAAEKSILTRIPTFVGALETAMVQSFNLSRVWVLLNSIHNIDNMKKKMACLIGLYICMSVRLALKNLHAANYTEEVLWDRLKRIEECYVETTDLGEYVIAMYVLYGLQNVYMYVGLLGLYLCVGLYKFFRAPN